MILKLIRNSRLFKVISFFLAISFFFDILHPLNIFALTGGPAQPEVESFSPVNTTEMVDLFSGDFKYNIPLLTVPGSNGGYPISLFYNGGVGMEQEASWVGLGWNINTGCVTRNMRGLPDDFKGDVVTKKYNKKANRTYALFGDINAEAIGLDLAKGLGLTLSGEIFYNNYKGLGIDVGLGLSYTGHSSFSSGLGTSLNVSLNSQGGISPSLSFSYCKEEKDKIFNPSSIGFSYNSRQGIIGMNTSISCPKYGVKSSTGTTFGTATFVPPVNMPLTGGSARFSIKLGTSGVVFPNANLGVSYSEQKIKQHEKDIEAFGLMYAESATDNDLKDFNREKDFTVNKNSKNLPVPVLTQDIFNVSGEGMVGAFRLYRSDMGYISDHNMEQNFDGGQLGLDIGSSASTTHIGVNIEVNFANSYSGCWQDGYDNTNIGFKSGPVAGTISSRLYEPAYFKMMGEKTSNQPDYLDHLAKYYPIQFDEYKGDDRKPKINNSVNWASHQSNITKSTRSDREKREQLVEYFTVQELNYIYGQGYTQNQFAQNHHIGSFAILKTDGSRYQYDLPVYNSVHKDVMFSVEPGSSFDVTKKRVTYSTQDASINNKKGLDHIYTSTEMPPYAYAYYLTSVTSPDYFDVSGDGPSDDDMGFWVSFKYTEPYIYKWRMPFKDALYNRGYESDEFDDKANYSYGEKEIVYIERIETNTHYAKFISENRSDALGVNEEYNVTNGSLYGANQKMLTKIELFSKNDTTTPIKTVHFEYNFELCDNTENSLDINMNFYGKLTLKKVWFSYGSNQKGKFSPYEFNYSSCNPDYNIGQVDRWGNYNPHCTAANPYVCQNNDSIDYWASAWLLSQIILPSGGKINIEYESDDYAYVQDKPAMQMFKIAGIGSPGEDKLIGISSDNRNKVYIIRDPDDENNINYYIKNLKDNLMYFKVFMKLDRKSDEANSLFDYVEGYAEIDPSQCDIYDNDYALIVLKEPDDKPSANAFRFAGWQYLRTQRPDVLYHNTPSDSPILSVVNILISIVTDLGSLFMGYYNFCIATGLCSRIIINQAGATYTGTSNYDKYLRNCPSYVKLNTPDMIKKGGGHRVKRIALSDDWTKSEQNEYAQTYKYTLYQNGRLISSGVAEYEPMLGSEENPLKYPVRYSTENTFNNDRALYCEEPFNESYFPAPNIGYSRVTVYTETPLNVNRSAPGIQVSEFYTAKDYPVLYSYTSIDNDAKHTPFPIQIPLIGYKTYHSQGYTQGYMIMLNDMHGKQKSQSTYLAGDNVITANPQPFTKVEYLYFTNGAYNPNKVNTINNKVNVINNDGLISQKILGETYDIFTDLRENYTYSEAYGLLFNMDLAAIIPIPMAIVDVENTEETFRTAVTNKIIYQTAILSETRTYQDGATRVLRNVLFDEETGTPVLTTENNDFDKPVYNTVYPAYWFYKGMGPAYKTYRARAESYPNLSYLMSGDIVLTETNDIGFVHSDASYHNIQNQVFVPNNDNNKVIRSGYTNQQSIPAGSLVSLSNPFTDRYFPLFDAFNNKGCWIAYDTTYIGSPPGQTVIYVATFAVADCSGKSDTITACAQNNKLSFCKKNKGYSLPTDPECESGCYCHVDINDALSACPDQNLYNITLVKLISDKVQVKYLGSLVNTITWTDADNCFRVCIDDVLKAEASVYNDSWTFDYLDAWSNHNPSNINPYWNKNLGCWKLVRSNMYRIPRKQSGSLPSQTKVNIDGTYSYFYEYNWFNENDENQQYPWIWSNFISKYSPRGYELENKNPLGIYSSALYGYDYTQAVAVSNNARYYEIAYNGFEDYTAASANFSHGHFSYTQTAGADTSSDFAHTGFKSMKIDPAKYIELTVPLADQLSYHPNEFTLMKSKKYLLGFWVKKIGNASPVLYIDNNFTSIVIEKPIDGWCRVEIPFTTTANSSLTIKFMSMSDIVYYDDFRIQPFNSSMKTYVYDLLKHILVAELDENNFATFYNYDEEGKLVQIKKETTRGVMTIKSFRQNFSRRPIN